MIIKIQTAKRLIKSGKADHIGNVTSDGKKYMVVDRYDMQRTDHVLIG